MSPDIAQYKARWPQAYTDNDLRAQLDFYPPDMICKDPQVPDGLRGQKQLAAFLTRLVRGNPADAARPQRGFGQPTLDSEAAGFARSIRAAEPRPTSPASSWSCPGDQIVLN